MLRLDRGWGGSRKPSCCHNPGENGWWFRVGGGGRESKESRSGYLSKAVDEGSKRESFSVLELLVAQNNRNRFSQIQNSNSAPPPPLAAGILSIVATPAARGLSLSVCLLQGGNPGGSHLQIFNYTFKYTFFPNQVTPTGSTMWTYLLRRHYSTHYGNQE